MTKEQKQTWDLEKFLFTDFRIRSRCHSERNQVLTSNSHFLILYLCNLIFEIYSISSNRILGFTIYIFAFLRYWVAKIYIWDQKIRVCSKIIKKADQINKKQRACEIREVFENYNVKEHRKVLHSISIILLEFL